MRRSRPLRARRVLFGLPRLLRAVQAGEPVYVVEGEKDALTAERLGLAATCNPGGAGKWRPAYSEPLREAEVRVVPDADKPGMDHARQVAQSLEGVARSVAILALPEGAKDLSELVERRTSEGRSLAEIREEVESLPEAAEAGDESLVVAADEGPLPLRRPTPAPAPYPTGELPPVLRCAVEAIAERVRVPEAMAAGSVLSAAAFVTQAHVDVHLPGAEQRRPTSLYFLTIAESGDRKTTSDAEATVGVEARERELRANHPVEARAFRDRRDAWEKTRAEILGRKAAGTPGQRLADREEKLASLPDPPEPPPDPQLRPDSPTLEGLCRLLHEGWPSIYLASSEGGQWIGGWSMNRDNRLRTVSGLSDLWGGQTITRTRGGDRGRERDAIQTLPGRRVSLHIMAQPSVATGLLEDELVWDQGFIARCLIAWPESLAGGRFWEPGELPPREPINAFSSHVLALLRRPMPFAFNDRGKRDGLAPRVLQFGPESRETLRRFHNAIEERIGPGGELAPVKGVAAKSLEQACRLAAVFAFLDDPDAREIAIEQTEAAVVVAQYYLLETLRIRERAAVPPDILQADRLSCWLRSQNVEKVSLREILWRGPNQTRDREAAIRALRILEAHRHVVALGEAEVDGKRAREAWRVLPWEEGGS